MNELLYGTNELLEWNGNYYSTYTIFKMKESYINTHTCYGKRIWPYAALIRIILDSNKNILRYHFVPHGCKYPISQNYLGGFDVEISQIDSAIESVYAGKPMPKEMIYVPQPKSDFEIPGMLTLWAIYIIVMVASMIFKDFIIIWAFASYGFFKLRKELKKP